MFHKDVKFGKHYENLWASQFQNPELCPKKVFSDWDVKTPDEVYEVKADRLVSKYGNFFIEYECSKKPSGISTTKASHWVLYDVLPDSTPFGEVRACYKVPKDTLLSLASTCPSRAGGDNWKSKGWLLPHETIKQYQLFCNL
jgi:hypothetical protein